MPTAVTIKLPRKFRFLTEPHRYKIAWGGRGGLKSWTYARALLIAAATTPLRILCAREIQKSIRDSVHTLLRDQISLLGLDQFYTVLDTEIRGLNGSLFIFAGLADHTVTSIKSFEGIDKVWIEEAQAVSKKSWDILVPTIRKEGSEIWISFNPELDTDETYVRFITVPPPGAVVVHTTYQDNPWFSAELEAERAHDEIMKPKDDYEHIWLGKCRSALSGAIFASEVAKMVEDQRITRVPYDPRLKVHAVWDMGWNDQMSVGMYQRGIADVRCIDYREYQFKRVDEIAGELRAIPYNWGFDFLPWDGWTESRQTGKSDAQLLQSFGRRVKKVPSVENAQEARIRALRQLFPRIYVDAAKCVRLIECWKRYRRNVPKHGEPASPIHDEYAHGCLGPETMIRTLRGWKRIIDLAGTEFYVWGYSQQEHRLVPAKALRCWKTKTTDQIVKIELDNRTIVTCTPDHRFMLRNEVWREAKDLVLGDSLMPFYEQTENKHIKIHLNDGSLATEHRYVYVRLKGPLKDGYHIHHVDNDKINNDPSNLEQLTSSEHCAIHSSTPEHLAHLRRISNRIPSPRATEILISVNKQRAGDAHHTRQPGYWTSERRQRNGEVFARHEKASEKSKQCEGCGAEFIGCWKRSFCCRNCKARAWRRRKGMPESPWRQFLHASDCRMTMALNHRVVSVECVNERTDVYDIEVEGIHSFVADGVVVHNCDQSGYMALVVEQMTNEDVAEPRINVAVPQNYGTMGGLGAR